MIFAMSISGLAVSIYWNFSIYKSTVYGALPGFIVSFAVYLLFAILKKKEKSAEKIDSFQ